MCHRDVKPSNCLLMGRGRGAALVDFGVSLLGCNEWDGGRAARVKGALPAGYSSGTVACCASASPLLEHVGTAAFMAPEVSGLVSGSAPHARSQSTQFPVVLPALRARYFRDRDSGVPLRPPCAACSDRLLVAAAADIWSLGATLTAIASSPFFASRGFSPPSRWSELVQAMLQSDPRARPTAVEAFAASGLSEERELAAPVEVADREDLSHAELSVTLPHVHPPPRSLGGGVRIRVKRRPTADIAAGPAPEPSPIPPRMLEAQVILIPESSAPAPVSAVLLRGVHLPEAPRRSRSPFERRVTFQQHSALDVGDQRVLRPATAIRVGRPHVADPLHTPPSKRDGSDLDAVERSAVAEPAHVSELQRYCSHASESQVSGPHASSREDVLVQRPAAVADSYLHAEAAGVDVEAAPTQRGLTVSEALTSESTTVDKESQRRDIETRRAQRRARAAAIMDFLPATPVSVPFA